MKLFFRYFFRFAHAIIGPVILLWDRLTTPGGLQRQPVDQQVINKTTQNMILYQFRMCPFCVRVRRQIKRLSLNIETRDALRDESSREQLLKGGGAVKVPCLRIAEEDGKEIWIYESADIIEYLEKRFA